MVNASPLKATMDLESPAQMMQSDMMTPSMLIFESNGVEFSLSGHNTYNIIVNGDSHNPTLALCRLVLCIS